MNHFTKRNSFGIWHLAVVFCLLLSALFTVTDAIAQEREHGGAARGRASFRGDEADINCLKAGELHEMITPEKMPMVRKLYISGVINVEDMKFIKTLATRTSAKNDRGRSIESFLDLNLGSVKLVKNDKYGRGVPLDELPSSLCSSWSRLRSVVLPRHIRAIGNYAFSSCSHLEMVEMPDHLEAIGDYAFQSCSQLTEAHIPQGVSEIGSNAFYGCSKLSDIRLPHLLGVVKKSAFERTAITFVDIPSSVASIEARAFANTKLQEVTIPAGVERLDVSAFSSCLQLAAIHVDNGNSAFSSRDGLLYDKSQGRLLCCPAGKRGTVSLPASTWRIDNGAFQGCAGLVNVVMGDGVREIGDNAFRGCSQLSRIQLPVGLQAIGNDALRECTGLTQVSLPQGLLKIGTSLFSGCKNLMSVVLPERLEELPERTFKNCERLGTVTLPQGLLAIGREAFYECRALMTIAIPPHVSVFGDECFRKCGQLTTFRFPAVTSLVGNRMLYDCDALQVVEMPMAIPPQVKHVCDVKGVMLKVPAGSAAAYKKADGWKKFQRIMEL